MPNSDSVTACIVWMQEFFETYGDSLPNSDGEYRIGVLSKKDAYTIYVQQHQQDNDGRVIDYERFTSIWKHLFPQVKTRTWVNVMGKCDTCNEIERARAANKDNKAIQKALSKAHALHRGGLFMLERLEYVIIPPPSVRAFYN